MSDNLPASEQEATTQPEQSIASMAESSTDKQLDGAAHTKAARSEDSHGNEEDQNEENDDTTIKQKEEATEATSAVAGAVSKALWQWLLSSLLCLSHFPFHQTVSALSSIVTQAMRQILFRHSVFLKPHLSLLSLTAICTPQPNS